MLHSPEYLEAKYATPDPWGYRIHPDDIERKRRILEAIEKIRPGHTFRRALDIGAGEGWITADLPALEIEAIEISDTAASRFPANMRRVSKPAGAYDLVLATGILYRHYNLRMFHNWILAHSDGIVITCSLEDSEILPLEWLRLDPTHEERFPYRGRVQHLCAWELR